MGETSQPRPSIQVELTCCRTYVCIRLRADGTAYAGHCPKCARPIVVPVAKGGSRSRFFRS